MAKRGRPRYPDILTPRESEVLALLREGLTNEQIAERLGVSRDGVKYHVSEILSKLGVTTREEAAAWRPEEARPWWTGGLAFIFWPARHFPFGAAATTAGAVAVVATAGGIALLAWGLAITNREDDATGLAQVPTATASAESTRLSPSPPATVIGTAIEFTVCVRDDAWVRPTAEEQEPIWQDPRFAPFPEELKAAFQAHFFRLTGSAVQEGQLRDWSGLWTSSEVRFETESCPGAPQGGMHPAITGEVVDLWILLHEVRSVEQTDDGVTVRVQPLERGYRFIRFPSPLNEASLGDMAITFVDPSGNKLGVIGLAEMQERMGVANETPQPTPTPTPTEEAPVDQPTRTATPQGSATVPPLEGTPMPLSQADALWGWIAANSPEVDPVLRPAYLPSNVTQVTVRMLDQRLGCVLFDIEYSDGTGNARLFVGGGPWYNPPLAGPEALQEQVSVRQTTGTYQLQDAANPLGQAFLWWQEPGRWGRPGDDWHRDYVEYLISSEGLPTEELLKVANGLQPVSARTGSPPLAISKTAP